VVDCEPDSTISGAPKTDRHMQKQWYPTAVTLVLLGCGGTANTTPGQEQGGATFDAGSPMETGGMPSVRYGILVTGGTGTQARASALGGNTGGIDTGVPSQAGGMPATKYGMLLPTGGKSGA